MNNIWILAQAEGENQPSGITSQPVDAEQTTTTVATEPNTPGTAAPMQRSPLMQFLPFMLIIVVMYLFLFRGPRKKQAQHKQMVQGLQRNDRIRTIGGIIGTVVDVKGDEITLKIDESNNTKIKIVSSAVGKNLSQEKA